MNLNKLCLSLLLTLLACSATAATEPATQAPRVSPVQKPAGAKALDAYIPGRIQRTSGKDTYQWPGVYFEAAFQGPKVYFEVGRGDVILRVLVDEKPVATLAKPAPGFYEIATLANRRHTVRIEALTESQAGPNVFGGFLYSTGTQPLTVAHHARQIEFIGDSHTVGYGNTSPSRDCTEKEVWATTDNSQAFGPKVAAHYDADFQINAISGRGIVRNYGGFTADPMPEAYPFTLLDHSARYEDSTWRPQIIVIALGTNDFSTALNPGEKWKTRNELRADFESTYVRFIDSLRARNREAFIIVWATDMAEGEIESEARRVVSQLESAGEKRIAFVPIHGLAMTGCHWHPSVADDDLIAAKLIGVIDGNRASWGTP